jgi:hypothetical protein
VPNKMTFCKYVSHRRIVQIEDKVTDSINFKLFDSVCVKKEICVDNSVDNFSIDTPCVELKSNVQFHAIDCVSNSCLVTNC